MKLEFNFNNSENFLFHDFNQRKNKKYWYFCSIFAPIINITVNCKKTHNIDFTREDIDIIGDRMVKAGKLGSKGGLGIDGVNYVYSYVKEQVKKGRQNINFQKWKCPNLATFYNEDEDELMKFINRGYVAIVGMGVNTEFVRDMIDGKIEKYEDYKNYKGDKLKHFTNMGKWLRGGSNIGEEFILDSYAHNQHGLERIYWNFSIKEGLEDLLFRSKYLFF